MKIANEIFAEIADEVDEGLVLIDSKKNIKLINKRAKEITGLIIDSKIVQEAGKISKGDIVIVASNLLAYDDGGLEKSDFEKLNIFDENIEKGVSIIAISSFQNSEIKPVYKLIKNFVGNEMSLENEFLGIDIKVLIDFQNRIINIKVNGNNYPMSYINAIGHILILDKDTAKLKFYQAKGYTIRRETVKEVLNGKIFLAKNSKSKVDLLNFGLSELIEDSKIIEICDDILANNLSSIKDEFLEINRRPVICSIDKILYDEDEKYLLLRIRDLSELENLLDERNKIIEEVEKRYIKKTYSKASYPKELDKFIGSSLEIEKIKNLASKAAMIPANVLISGESGTGKSFLAKLIHDINRKNSPFVEVNCSAISNNLYESELFGYVGGAFTGALPKGKIGYFEQAHTGTIFLDEIGEMPLDMQVKLLHVIQNKKFFKVGSAKAITADFRIIAASNRDLEKEVIDGKFRKDLFYRLNVFPIEISSLRERQADIYPLINVSLAKACKMYDIPLKKLSGSAFNKLLNYSWPGNVRELENIIERAVVLCEGQMIYPEHININSYEKKKTLKMFLENAEEEAIKNALIFANADKKLAIEQLDISKSSFYEKLLKYGIE